MNNLSWVIGLADYLNLEWHGCPGISLWSQTKSSPVQRKYITLSARVRTFKYLLLKDPTSCVFISNDWIKSVDYLQIFLSPPKLFILFYLLTFLSCPVTLYTSKARAHRVFRVCSSIMSFPTSVRPSLSPWLA